MSLTKMKKKSLPSKSILEDSYPRKCSIFFPKPSEQVSLKILSSKKLEKYEKEAINYFYANQHQQCFDCLDKCLNLLRKQPMIDHQIYVYYLYVQFLVKLKEFRMADSYLIKAKELVGRMNMSQRQRNHQYIVSIETLQICLQCEKNNHQRVLNLIQVFNNREKQQLSEKIYKQIKNSEILSYMGLNKCQFALKCINQLLSKVESDVDKIRFNILKVKCLYHMNPSQINKYVGMFEEILIQTQKIHDKKQKKQIKLKVYQNLNEITEKDLIKSIYYLQQFLRQDIVDSSSLVQTERKLFSAYHQIGDFDKCIEIFDRLKALDLQLKIITSTDMIKYGQILEFYEQKQDAFTVYSKALEMETDDIEKLRISLKLLKFDSQESLVKSLLKKIEKKLKQQSIKNKIEASNVQNLREQFVEYLKIVGKIDKANKFSRKQTQRKQDTVLKQRDCNSLNCTSRRMFK